MWNPAALAPDRDSGSPYIETGMTVFELIDLFCPDGFNMLKNRWIFREVN